MESRDNHQSSFKHSISIAFVQQFDSLLKYKGVDTENLAKMAGISNAVLKHKESRIAPQQFSEYMRSVIYITKDEFLTCGVSKVPFGHFQKMAAETLLMPNLHLARKFR